MASMSPQISGLRTFWASEVQIPAKLFRRGIIFCTLQISGRGSLKSAWPDGRRMRYQSPVKVNHTPQSTNDKQTNPKPWGVNLDPCSLETQGHGPGIP